MNKDNTPRLYWAWGHEFAAYGPVELPALIEWIKRERINAESWIYRDPENIWIQAGQIPELKMFFQPKRDAWQQSAAGQVSSGTLRRIKVFAGMDHHQLEAFLQYMELVNVAKNKLMIKLGDHGDAMYLVLAGEVRASVMVDGKESVLSTLRVGDFLGEISLLDEGPRSANVTANEDSVLLKITAESFQRMVAKEPALATPFLYALSRSVVTRLRHLTKRYQDSMHCIHLVNLYYAPKPKRKAAKA